MAEGRLWEIYETGFAGLINLSSAPSLGFLNFFWRSRLWAGTVPKPSDSFAKK